MGEFENVRICGESARGRREEEERIERKIRGDGEMERRREEGKTRIEAEEEMRMIERTQERVK